MRRTEIVFTLIFAFAFFFCPSALAKENTLAVNERLIVSSTEEVYYFTAPSNNLYTFSYFGDMDAYGALYQEGEAEAVAADGGFRFSARLISGKRYRLEVSDGEGGAVEIMRSAMGRTFDRPIQLLSLAEGYDKVIARAYDTHWYTFTAPTSGIYVISTSSEIDTTGYLLDAQGKAITSSDDAFSPYERNFRIEAMLTAGEVYLIRIGAKEDATGAYHLSILEPIPGAKQPASLSLSQTETKMHAGDVITLTVSVQPEDAQADIAWVSTDPNIARVTPKGEVIAVSTGECEIIAYSGDRAQARCRILVASIPVVSLSFDEKRLTLPVNTSAQPGYSILPENASNQKVRFESSDESVLTIDDRGTVTGIRMGTATVTATTRDGGYQSTIEVEVTRAEPVYRALLVGEQRYLDGRLRIGSINTTQGMADLLTNAGDYSVTMKLDNTRNELFTAIRDTFRDAKPTDISLFYINCHGGYDSGRAWVETHDGSRISAQQLEQALRRIPGTVIVIIDSCQSGSFLSSAITEDFNRGIIQAFSSGAAGSFAMSKYRVMTSSSSTQNSYRISYNGPDSEADMSTVFIRSLCEAGGWDLIKDRKTTMRADADKDWTVTFEEAYLYTRRRVRKYLEAYGYEQDVQVFPAGSTLTLFNRS